jgi:hypothetical protein
MGGVVAVDPVDVDTIMNQPGRVQAWRRIAETVADRVGPLVDLTRPYVDGQQNLPSDGRFLLVGNHTQGGVEALLVPYLVRREIGIRVRPLTDRSIGRMRGPAADLLAACGAVVGAQRDRTEELGDIGSDHFAEEGLLVAEVGVEAFLARLGGPGDAVDPGPGQPVLGEFGSGGPQNFAAQLCRGSHRRIIPKRTSSFGSVVASV